MCKGIYLAYMQRDILICVLRPLALCNIEKSSCVSAGVGLHCMCIDIFIKQQGGLVVKTFACCAEGPGFDPRAENLRTFIRKIPA